MDLATVAVPSDPDADAPFVAAADEAVRLPGAAPGETYLRGDLVVAAALATGADAVHPGYGFLSENAGFARACADAGLVFVGPSPEAIEAMGSKTAAKERMAAAGVPTLPGAVIGARGELDEAAVSRAAEGIGYPLLVKAAFGGGGGGMRVVPGAGGPGAGGGAACGASGRPASWPRRWPGRGARRRRRSVTAPSSSSGSSSGRGTSRCRSSATPTAPSSTSSNASARSSGGTRRSSRRRRPRW